MVAVGPNEESAPRVRSHLNNRWSSAIDGGAIAHGPARGRRLAGTDRVAC